MKTQKSLRTLFVIIAVFVASVASALNGFATETNQVCVQTVEDAANGQSFVWEWYAGRDVLEKQPRWDGFSTNAPFPIHEAIAKTMLQVEALHPEIQKWRVDSVFVRPLVYQAKREKSPWMKSVWIYNVQLVPENEAEHQRWEDNGQISIFNRVVLMDGTIIAPILKKGADN